MSERIRLPEAYLNKMKELLGDEYEQYLDCFENPRYYGLRVNTKKISVEEFIRICPFPIKPIPWIDNGFYYDGTQYSPARHPYYFAGLYYLQEPSAMTPANRLPVEPGDKVLDLCAAPGGKTTELGAKLNTEGVLVANDISNSRAKGLLKNVELFGIGNVLVVSEEPGKLAGFFPEYFDKILIDAPCSGEGMFRKEFRMVKAWEEHGPEFFAKIQRNILTTAVSMLKPGGYLMYSTCTFDQEENEGSIIHLLSEYPDMEVCEMTPYEGFCCGIPKEGCEYADDLRKTVRIFPHRMKGEGHYLALLRKKERENRKRANQEKIYRKSVRPSRLLSDEAADFLNMIDLTCLDPDFDWGNIQVQKERVYYMPKDLPKLGQIRFLRSGLLLGEQKKNRFEPSQALAMCLKADCYPNVISLPASDERIIRYLKGETLDVSDMIGKKEKGWYLFCVDSYPLGWGKVGAQTLKNKYLPGWRMLSKG